MGRPLNDRFFTSVDGEGPTNTAGLQIFLTAASFTEGPTDAINTWIVRQRSPERYEVTNGTNTEVLKMFDGGEVPAGRCSLKVIPFDGQPPEYVRTFTSHHVKTFDGNVYIWTHLQSSNPADAVGEVDFVPVLDIEIV